MREPTIPPDTPTYPRWAHNPWNATMRTLLGEIAYAIHGNDLAGTTIYHHCPAPNGEPWGLCRVGRVAAPLDRVMDNLPGYLMRVVLR